MDRNLKLAIVLFQHSSKRYLENRFNTFGQFVSATLETTIFIFLISFIFSHTKSLNGWDKFEVLLIVGISQFVIALYSFLFRRSVNRFPGLIRNGDMDFILTKPISSQVYSSLRFIKPFELLNSITGGIIIAYSLSNLTSTFPLVNWLFLMIGIICGVFVIYSICFSFTTLAFWSPKLNSTSSVWELMSTPLALPTDIYSPSISFIVTYVIPIGLVVTIPAKLFLGRIPFYFIFIEILLTALFFYLCTRFWNFAIKNYTSASS